MSAKRPAEETIPEQRRTRIKLASPSPDRTSESDTESIHSCQGYKTELANDTSDTSSSHNSQPYQTEYDVTDLEVQKYKFYFSEGSDMDEDNVQDAVLNVNSNDSLDNAVLGDSSEENSTSPTSNSDIDPGLPRNDYLDFEKCLLCKTSKKNICYPYCSTCFTWRKNLFPSRPKNKFQGYKKGGIQSEKYGRSQCVSDIQNEITNNFSNTKNKEGSSSDGLFEDSGVGSTEAQLSEDTVDGSLEPSTSSSTLSTTLNFPNSKSSDACRVCFLKPENGLFVHLSTAHRYGCYSCAREIWYRNGSCPMCRRKVSKVTKLFI